MPQTRFVYCQNFVIVLGLFIYIYIRQYDKGPKDLSIGTWVCYTRSRFVGWYLGEYMLGKPTSRCK